jgi:hypothetical protein
MHDREALAAGYLPASPPIIEGNGSARPSRIHHEYVSGGLCCIEQRRANALLHGLQTWTIVMAVDRQLDAYGPGEPRTPTF